MQEFIHQQLPELASLCLRLSELSNELEDHSQAWPEQQFHELAQAGVLGWVIPTEFGGKNITSEELTLGYVELTKACLTTTFVLTQRNGACQRLAGTENQTLKARLLPGLARGELFATVGISHLTTSRQHLKQPAVQAEETDTAWVLNGSVPWVTGAKAADYIVTGGTCADHRQILIALPTDLDGVDIHPPPNLLALNASQTGSVQLTHVSVSKEYLIAGPIENVMKQGTGGGAGSLTTSALALGLARNAGERLQEEAQNRADLLPIAEKLAADAWQLQADLHSAVTGEIGPHLTAESIRTQANSLALRTTQAYLAATKGAGFLSKHPASRLVREAMFFLVWSCPQPVLTAQLQEFACVLE